MLNWLDPQTNPEDLFCSFYLKRICDDFFLIVKTTWEQMAYNVRKLDYEKMEKRIAKQKKKIKTK